MASECKQKEQLPVKEWEHWDFLCCFFAASDACQQAANLLATHVKAANLEPWLLQRGPLPDVSGENARAEDAASRALPHARETADRAHVPHSVIHRFAELVEQALKHKRVGLDRLRAAEREHLGEGAPRAEEPEATRALRAELEAVRARVAELEAAQAGA